jgi:Protein of unknown function (DUF1761)
MIPVAHPLNLLAILVSAIILWVLGAIWYSPALFAKPWMQILGMKKEDSRRSFVYLGMVASFMGDFVLAYVLANIIIWSGATGFWLGAVWGVLIWFGFFGSVNLPQHLYEGRPFKLFAINNGYWLLGLFIVGGILTTWR